MELTERECELTQEALSIFLEVILDSDLIKEDNKKPLINEVVTIINKVRV